MMIFHFCVVCFTFSTSYSVPSFHLVYVFQFHHLCFFYVLSQAFIKHSRKAFVCVCVCVYIHTYIYI